MASNSYAATLQEQPEFPHMQPTRHTDRSPPHRASQHHFQQSFPTHSLYRPIPHRQRPCPSPQHLQPHEEYLAAPLTSLPQGKNREYHIDTETTQDSSNPSN